MSHNIKNIIIAGGGTSGWLSATALSSSLPKDIKITLVESDEIGIIGVGEATIPPIIDFIKRIGINEAEFVKECQASFKLGIEFIGWGKEDSCYIHPFGKYGIDMLGIKFHQFYLKALHNNAANIGEISDYNICAKAAYKDKFIIPQPNMGQVIGGLKYAYHFDASLFAKHLKKISISRGVKRIEGKIETINTDSNGNISELILADGQKVKGDLFIDCTGFRALLINGAMNIGYENWQDLLPCDSAWAVPSSNINPPPPYTKSFADNAGWRWRIPLQHRTGNGYVFCSKYISDEDAKQRLLETIEGEALSEPRLIKFTTGRREKFWVKNCVAIGLSSGFLEPLESTAIHLVQSAISKLLSLFPHSNFNQAEIDEFNNLMGLQYEQIRDFIIAHYKINTRQDSDFWTACQNLKIPETLTHKINLFENAGRLIHHEENLFADDNWLAVLMGQGITPKMHDVLVDAAPYTEVIQNLNRIKSVIDQASDNLPRHIEFINKFAPSPKQ